MMKTMTYLCHSRHTYLTLLVFAALTVVGHAQLDGDISVDYNDLVKVYISGKWTAICTSGNFTVHSQVLCQSFGQKFSSYTSRSSGVSGLIRNLKCRGDENSLAACFSFYIASYDCPYSKLHVQCQEDSTKAFCPFDNDICEMNIESTAGYKWQRFSPMGLSKLPQQSIPLTDHTTESEKGKYMLAAATSFPGEKTILKTKPFSGNINSVSFYYHMFGRDMGSLNVYIQANNSSKKSIRSISGNQGTGWKYLCLPVNQVNGAHVIIFEAIQGKGFDSDIALDDVTISNNNCSSHWNVSCDFNKSTCGYDIQNHGNIDFGWRLTGGFLQFLSSYYSYYSETRHSIKSLITEIPNEKMKLEFDYFLSGTKFQELQVKFVEEGLNPWLAETQYLWQDSGNLGLEWQYGCMDLPSKKGRIVITAIAEYRYASIGLDNIRIDKGHCQTGITHHMCTFDNKLLCGYEITCMNPKEYTWRRKKGSTPSYYTGPSGDNSLNENGYYIYAEASYGDSNDTTSLHFPVSKDAKGKQLKFDFNMYGYSVGQLHVVFVNYIGNSSFEKVVWSKTGDQGKYWHKACFYIENDISEIRFVAVRGSSYSGDIAIDNVVVEEKGCPGPFDCGFQDGPCNYKVDAYYYYFSVSYANRNLRIQSRTNSEDVKFKIKSPLADVVENTSVTFKYRMTGKMKELALITYSNYSSDKLWSSNFNDISELITACVNFPNSTNFGLIFQGTVNANSRYNTYTYLDDIEIQNGTCKMGLTYHFCKFKQVHLCDFYVECPANTRYNWSQGSSYDHSLPIRNSYQKYYYMYVDSINGKPGDKTHLSFPNVVPRAGQSLHIDYYLQQGSGTLEVLLETAYERKVVLKEFSVVASTAWQSGCVGVTNNVTNITFIATNGYGTGQFIAVTNVGFSDKKCEDSSISCGFTKDTCQYNNLNYYTTWTRTTSRDDSNSTDGFYMKTTLSYYSESMMASPTENITNSCVQIRYKISNKNCKLTIYNAFNNNTILSVVTDEETPWGIAQKYIQKETTKLVFHAKSMRYERCQILIDYVKVAKDNCSQLVCPPGTRKCKNDYCYSESKVCDRINDCSDGSDEMNCNTSIACEFTTKFYCGYKIVNGWYLSLDNYSSLINTPGSMQIIERKGQMISPVETLAESCVSIELTTARALTGNLSIILNQQNSNGIISYHHIWNEYFLRQKNGITKGQFQIPAGKIFLTFIADIKNGELAINSVRIFNGTCPELNCSKNFHACSDNSKCIIKENLCNNYKNCVNGSDEENCPKLLDCDFEDTDMCGFKSYPENSWWTSNGMFGRFPSLDHSKGTYEGQYIMSNSSETSILAVPQITSGDTFCFNFHYLFYGDGYVLVYANGTHQISLSKSDYDMWREANITLSNGTHNIFFAYSKTGNTSGTMALDSVSVIPGRCLHKRCEENWYPCNNNVTCYSVFEICDGINNCPNGEDEYNCTGQKREFKLTHGRSLWSGRAERRYGSNYIPICQGTLRNEIVNDICFELGANVTTTQTRIQTYIVGYYYTYYYYYGYAQWRSHSCTRGCFCSSSYVACSNTTCEDGEVRCPPNPKEANYTNVCIRKESMCDGEIDCEGGTDEMNCASCAIGHWQCQNLKCIKEGLRCDGKKDCLDGSDEFHCFTYKNNTILVYHNGSYENICIDNLNNEKVANHLCSTVGRSNGTFGNSADGNGIKFIQNSLDSNTELIPGYKLNSFEKCKVMKLECTEEVCGTRKRPLFEPNVQNGHDAVQGKWPWTIVLYIGSTFQCTGSLLSKHYVLTAAHCITRYGNRYTIRAGSINRKEGKVYEVKYFYKHNNYKHFLKGYDIALLYIEEEIMFSENVQPICLPKNPAPLYKDYYVTGWGRNEKDEYSLTLQETKIRLLEHQSCQEYFPDITDAVLCGNNKEYYSPICFGDSGGLLQTRNENGQWEVQGVNSFVASDCRYTISHPAGYSSVYHGLDWIKNYVH